MKPIREQLLLRGSDVTLRRILDVTTAGSPVMKMTGALCSGHVDPVARAIDSALWNRRGSRRLRVKPE